MLQELFGLVLEAREGYHPGQDGGNADWEVISKVMACIFAFSVLDVTM